jgi:hypothetical protein
VVALLDDDVSLETGEAWGRAIRSFVEDEPDPKDLLSASAARAAAASNGQVKISLLRPRLDLQTDTGRPASSLAFRTLHDSIRDASLRYYRGRAARVRAKLANLLLSSPPSPPSSELEEAGDVDDDDGDRRRSGSWRSLLPRIVRYCFKAAVFCEFQLEPGLSARYLSEAWRHAALYRSRLLRRGLLLAPGPPKPSQPKTKTTVHASSSDGGDLEVSLSNPPPPSSRRREDEPAPGGGNPLDCLYQAYAVAEWVHLKLLLAGLAPHSDDAGRRAARDQCRRHGAAFGSGGSGSPSDPDAQAASRALPPWFLWQYAARERLVLAQLAERHQPPPMPPQSAAAAPPPSQQERRLREEVAMRFSPWRCYLSASEARLELAHALEAAAADASPCPPVFGPGGRDLAGARDPARRPYVRGVDGDHGHAAVRDAVEAEFRRARAVDHRGA